MRTLALATLLGLALAAGLLLLGLYLWDGRRITLTSRLAPHFGGGRPEWGWKPGASAKRNRPRTGDAALSSRLRAAGHPATPAGYRSTTLTLATLAATAALAVVVLGALQGPANPLQALLLIAGSAVCVVWLRQRWLTSRASRRRARMSAQFPALAEMLALSVSAGDSLGPALHRSAASLRGELAEELQSALVEVRTGSALLTALERFADTAQLPSLSRCVDALTVASERGTPLAAVLRDQAADAREAARRELLEAAGKKEISMMIPVVFGVLPLSVLFAIFPGMSLLTFSV